MLGTLPFTHDELRDGYYQMQRILQVVEAPQPSRKLGQAAAAGAAARLVVPPRSVSGSSRRRCPT